jgi:uncharacterized protein YcnI
MRVRVIMRSLALAVACAAGGAAFGHVTVWPKQSGPSAYERYTIRVPNEKEVDTVSVRVDFPTGIRVEAFEQKPGWTAIPVRDGGGRIASVLWTGNLAPHEFTELGIIAVNPSSEGELVWTAVQTYADGATVEWAGPPGSATPAPRTSVSHADDQQPHRH